MKPLHETAYDNVVLCERYPERKSCNGCSNLRACILANLNYKGDDYWDERALKLYEQGYDDISYEDWLQGGCVDRGMTNPLKDDEFLKVISESFWKQNNG
jgi:hypothetical protein